MEKTDLRHSNNTKAQKLFRAYTKKWVAVSGKEIDLTAIYPKKMVEYNNDTIEVEHKGNIVNLDFNEETSTLQDIDWLVDIKTASGYIIRNIQLPKPICSSETYEEICEMKSMLANKVQNNIGNFDWKENKNKMIAELEKLMRCKTIKTFCVRNMIARHSLQNHFPILWKKLN